MAGRGAARIAQYVAGLSLLALWGADDFARYAAATGVGVWVVALCASGIERGALVLVGRDGGGRLEALFAWFGTAPLVVALLVWGALAAVWPGSLAAAYAGGVAFMAGTGSVSVLVALFRLRGRPGADAAAYAALCGAFVVAFLLAAVAGFGVDRVLASLTAIVVLITVVLLVALRPAVGRVARAAEVLGSARTVGLLAAGDVLGAGALSVLFALLAARAPASEASTFYVCLVASTAVGVVVNYLMRLWQRDVLRWLARSPATALAHTRRGLSLFTAVGGVMTAGATAVVLAAPGRVATVVALVVEIATFVAVAAGAFVVESVDDRSRLRSAASALVSLAVIGGLAWLLIPVGGAAGALVATAAGWVARGPVLILGLGSTAVHIKSSESDERDETMAMPDGAVVNQPHSSISDA